jgi:hypothetical protein
VLNVVDEYPDKHGFSTSGCSRNHAGKRVPPQEGYVYTPPPPRGPPLSSLQHQIETEEPYFIYSTDDPFVFKVPSTNPTLIVSMLDKYN